MDRARWLEGRLRAAFRPLHLEIVDESARHAGHPGAARGGGHYRVVLVSDAFRGRDLLARQRAVYAALEEGMQDIVHALALRTLTPEEWEGRKTREPGRSIKTR
jgi:BolA protein